MEVRHSRVGGATEPGGGCAWKVARVAAAEAWCVAGGDGPILKARDTHHIRRPETGGKP